jgi:lipoate-protein ligase A
MVANPNPNGDPLRLIHDAAANGVENMARDEALLHTVGDGAAPPTLRFYEWSPPTVSLGYFQPFAHFEALPPPAGELAVVRRQTGGGAILHDQELTYSLTFPIDHPLVSRGTRKLYEIVHQSLISLIQTANPPSESDSLVFSGQTDDSGAAKGPFFCFERRHRLDVLIGGDKLAGSAQRRSRKAVLQHGSIVVARRFDQQPAATIPPGWSVGRLRELWPTSLALALGLSLQAGEYEVELERLGELRQKYGSEEWTRKY